jgi:hypothetical protein
MVHALKRRPKEVDAETIIAAVTGVTKKWAKQRKAEERDASRKARRREALVKVQRFTIKDAAWDVMEAAYLKASNNGQYPAHARQIMYAARGKIQDLTGEMLDDQYFTQGLLPDYLRCYPQKTANWDVVFDARGHFTEPHTEKIVPLGTLEVGKYLSDVRVAAEGASTSIEVSVGGSRFPTCGPKNRFNAILFIEKEGFMPLFQKARLAKRFDIAIMSTKGLSVTASRLLVDELCSKNKIPLLVLHDFDKAGFSIVGTLRRNTRRYRFKNKIQVIDLGLRLEDVEACGLESEDVHYRSDPTENLRKNGATDEEIDFLCGNGYHGERVELNAFDSASFITWIEGKLQEHGIEKVVPDATTLEAAYRRAKEKALLEERLEEISEEVQREVSEAAVPEELESEIRSALEAYPGLSWDAALADLVAADDEDDS